MSEKSKNILLGVLIVGLVSMTVAYAALSTNLAINGTANVAATSWDIHFTNVKDATASANTLGGTNDGRVTSMGTLDGASGYNTSATGTLINDVTVSLAKPGDSAKISFDIVNTGTIDAKLASFSKSITKTGGSSAETTNDGITYTITCNSATPAAEAAAQELVKSTGKVSCELYVHYDELGATTGAQTSQTAGQNQTAGIDARTFTLTAAWNYVQK